MVSKPLPNLELYCTVEGYVIVTYCTYHFSMYIVHSVPKTLDLLDFLLSDNKIEIIQNTNT